MLKICPQCQEEFETKYKSNLYCSVSCKEIFRNLEHARKWAEKPTRKKAALQDHQRFTVCRSMGELD